MRWRQSSSIEAKHTGEQGMNALIDDGEEQGHVEEQPLLGRSWLRALGPLPDDSATHQAALVMISDYSLLSTVFYPHPYSNPIKHFMAASLDHAIWFHHPGKMDDWVLYDCDTPRAGGGRGFSRGFLWSQDGTLLASTAQESLMRIKQH